MNKGQRSFSVIHLKSQSKGAKTKEGGRYISKTPMGAALKAFNRECRSSKIKGQCSLVTILRETTSGSKHKLYRYKMRRNKLNKPKIILMNGTEVTIKYKTTAKQMKKHDSKAMKKMMGGGNNDMDLDDEEDEGIFTGYYNIIAHDSIIHTDYFLMPNEESDGSIIKKIMKKHKKEFKEAGIKRDVSIEIFDTMFYPREEGANGVKSALQVQLPHIRQAMRNLNSHAIKERKRNAFDFSDISAMLDNL